RNAPPGQYGRGGFLKTAMFLRRLPIHVVFSVLASGNPWLGVSAVLSAEPSSSQEAATKASKPPIEAEQPDNPPGEFAARDNPLARSPQPSVMVGPYQSIQVNVDALGQNIVGDAANEPSIAVNPTNPLNMV